MISMHLCKKYWTKKPCPECCATPINGLRNYFEPRLVARQLWYVAGEAFLLCSLPAVRPGRVLIIHQREDICLYWVTRLIKAPPPPTLPPEDKKPKWADKGWHIDKAPAQTQTSNLPGHFRWCHHLVTAQRTKSQSETAVNPRPLSPPARSPVFRGALMVLGVEKAENWLGSNNVFPFLNYVAVKRTFWEKKSHSWLTNK